jgi:hypothetical protein
MAEPLTEYTPLKIKIREYMNAAADHMASGGCMNFDEYQRMVGKVEALALVERDILDFEEKYIES